MGRKEEITDIPLWENEMPEICRFCAFGARISNSEDVFCEKKKQILPEGYSCKKFIYDILKKEVRRRKRVTPKFNPGDFEI